MSAENNAAGTEAFPSPGGFSPRPQGRSSRERSELNHSRITEVKFCPGGQSEIRLAPGKITSCEPVKLLPPAAVMEFRSPLGCHSSSLPPPCGGNFTIYIVDNFARATGENFTARQGNFTCGLARTSSHLSFASLWNHLLNDIQVPDNKKNLCRGEQLRAQSQSALLPRALQPVVQTTPAPFPATSALNDNAPPPLLFCTSSGLSPCSSLCLCRIRIGRLLGKNNRPCPLVRPSTYN